MKKGKEKRRKITLKKGGKALKIYLPGEKKEPQKRGGGECLKCTIYIPALRVAHRSFSCFAVLIVETGF